MLTVYILLFAYIVMGLVALWAIYNNKRLVEWEDKIWAIFKKFVRAKFAKARAGHSKTFLKALKPSAASSARVHSSGYVA